MMLWEGICDFWDVWIVGEKKKLFWILTGLLLFPIWLVILVVVQVLVLLYLIPYTIWDKWTDLSIKPYGFDTDTWKAENWRRWRDLGHPFADYSTDDRRRYEVKGIGRSNPGTDPRFRQPDSEDRLTMAMDGVGGWSHNTYHYAVDDETYWKEFYGRMPAALAKRAEWERRHALVIKWGFDRLTRMGGKASFPAETANESRLQTRPSAKE
jgi:hypothetical protein